MKYILPLLYCIILNACSSTESKKSSAYDSSMVAIQARNKAKEDSIQTFYTKEQEKVIGDITFGINEKTFDRLLSKFKKSTKVDIVDHQIGNYIFWDVDGLFYKKKLHEVDISGYPFNYADYDTKLLPQVDALYDLIKVKYGEPKYNRGPIPFHQTENDKSYLAYGWSVGKKTIQIYINSHNTTYRVNLEIFQSDIRDILNREFEREQETKTRKDSEVL